MIRSTMTDGTVHYNAPVSRYLFDMIELTVSPVGTLS